MLSARGRRRRRRVLDSFITNQRCFGRRRGGAGRGATFKCRRECTQVPLPVRHLKRQSAPQGRKAGKAPNPESGLLAKVSRFFFYLFLPSLFSVFVIGEW